MAERWSQGRFACPPVANCWGKEKLNLKGNVEERKPIIILIYSTVSTRHLLINLRVGSAATVQAQTAGGQTDRL